MKVYSPGDVADVLKVKESTLRKYSLLLEEYGYKYQRNNQNQRWYNDTDIVVLKKLVALKDSTDMSLKECAEKAFLWSKGGDITGPPTVPSSDTKRHDDDITELKDLVHTQNKVIEKLVERLDQQQKHFDDRFNKIENRQNERDKLLMETIRTVQNETQKQIATAEEEKKKGFWFRLFGGK